MCLEATYDRSKTPQFKKGDRVLAEGQAGTVTKAFGDNSCWVIRDGERVELPFSQSQLQLLSIDDQIKAAQAEVDRLRALKRESDKPKVGETWAVRNGRPVHNGRPVDTAEILCVGEERAFIRWSWGREGVLDLQYMQGEGSQYVRVDKP